MIALRFNLLTNQFRLREPINTVAMKYFILAINMKLHFLEHIDCSECTIVEHNGKPTIAYPMNYLQDCNFQMTKSVYQGFMSVPDAPSGYRTGCNYTIDTFNRCLVLHTMR